MSRPSTLPDLGAPAIRLVEDIRAFMKLESAGGLLLIAAAAIAILVANSPLSGLYQQFLMLPMVIAIGDFDISKPLLLWINDGLMAIFFFLIGLEVKREVLEGKLRSREQATLPVAAAIGGVAAPAIVYLLISAGDPVAGRGWAIPAATDIAFTLGILGLLGRAVPQSLKIFLLAVAIIDDLAAVVIIAIFYTVDVSPVALGLSAIGVFAAFMLNRRGVTSLTPYALVAAFAWVCVLKSGVHATLAGILVAFAIPLRKPGRNGVSPLHRAEHALHPYVAFGILPLFAFANAGLDLRGMSLADLGEPIPLGIAAGLAVGKPVGVLIMAALAMLVLRASMPEGMNARHLAGAACLTGVGFTMSFFIGGLAFDDSETLDMVRLGILVGSLISAALGLALVRLGGPAKSAGETSPAAS